MELDSNESFSETEKSSDTPFPALSSQLRTSSIQSSSSYDSAYSYSYDYSYDEGDDESCSLLSPTHALSSADGPKSISSKMTSINRKASEVTYFSSAREFLIFIDNLVNDVCELTGMPYSTCFYLLKTYKWNSDLLTKELKLDSELDQDEMSKHITSLLDHHRISIVPSIVKKKCAYSEVYALT
jgi:hypothetical protein